MVSNSKNSATLHTPTSYKLLRAQSISVMRDSSSNQIHTKLQNILLRAFTIKSLIKGAGIDIRGKY
jgi:hypothetical protein